MISPGGLTATLLNSNTVLGSRYWRMYQASNTRGNSGGYEWHLANYQMTGPNAAATVANTTASSYRSGYSVVDFFGPTYGVFGSYLAGQWLKTDFLTPKAIATVKYSNYGGSWAPTLVWVQSSDDGVNWVTRKVHNDTNTSSLQTIVIA